MQDTTCCFTGHRRFTQEQIKEILLNLPIEVDKLIHKAVNTFVCGGALGFDQYSDTVSRVEQYIRNNLSGDLSLRAIAEHAGIRIFRRIYGTGR